MTRATAPPLFDRIIGIDYSGASTPTDSLTGLRVFASEGLAPPIEVAPPASPRRYWTRQGLAHWLVEQLAVDARTLVGIDHAFSFPLRYFEAYNLAHDWPAFLDDFQSHWPTDGDHTYVDHLRQDPWLRFIRQRLEARVHCWPFDGWSLSGRSVLAEVYPSLWSGMFARDGGHTKDQHDAFAVAEWLRRAELAGELAPLFETALSVGERKIASIEGWILGLG